MLIFSFGITKQPTSCVLLKTFIAMEKAFSKLIVFYDLYHSNPVYENKQEMKLNWILVLADSRTKSLSKFYHGFPHGLPLRKMSICQKCLPPERLIVSFEA